MTTYTSYRLIIESFIFVIDANTIGDNFNYFVFSLRTRTNRFTYGIFSQLRRKLDAPPWHITVTITIIDVVVNIACRASDTVLRNARLKDIAPRRPAKNSMCWKFIDIFGFRPKLSKNDNGYMLAALPIAAHT